MKICASTYSSNIIIKVEKLVEYGTFDDDFHHHSLTNHLNHTSVINTINYVLESLIFSDYLSDVRKTTVYFRNCF